MPSSPTSTPAEYAEFMLAVFQHLRDKYGIVPDAIEMILEPDNGTSWTPSALGQAMVAAADRLGAGGVPSRVHRALGR